MADEAARRGRIVRMLERLTGSLDATSLLIELMVGLVVIIGVTSASRIDFIDPSPDTDAMLATAVLVGVAWAVIDGAFVLIAALFRQGRVRRLARLAAELPADDPRLASEVREVAGASVADLLDEAGLDRAMGMVAASPALRVRPVRLTADDWSAAIATAIAMLLATLPPVVPFLLPLAEPLQVAASNAVAVAALFWLGWLWARWTDFPRWLCGLVVAGVGIAMVALTLLFDVA